MSLWGFGGVLSARRTASSRRRAISTSVSSVSGRGFVMSVPEDKDVTWPTFKVGPPNHIYAIGVLSAIYNEFEECILDTIEHFTDDRDLSSFLFEKMPTNIRLQWLGKLIELNNPHQDVKERIKAMMSAFSTCTDNRGLIVHSRIMAHRISTDAIVASKRTRKSGRKTTHEMSLAAIRKAADETYAWTMFSRHVIGYINRQEIEKKGFPKKGYRVVGPSTLPKIPPAPTALATNFPRT